MTEPMFREPHAELIYDGKSFILPSDSPTPRNDQMQGSIHDRIVELAGRTCYDSLNSSHSRDSTSYHEHIREVNHSSVLAHAAWTFQIDFDADRDMESAVKRAALAFLNRPGCHIAPSINGRSLRVRINLRAIRQWDRWPAQFEKGMVAAIGLALKEQAEKLAPLAGHGLQGNSQRLLDGWGGEVHLVEPLREQEVWVSFYLRSSRGASHETVRHSHDVGISQRSTRFCDESESSWIPHPELLEEERSCMADVAQLARQRYDDLVLTVQNRLATSGVDRLSARKQARGAARGVLGNALETRLVFTASLTQWKWMLHERMSAAADAEIRLLFVQVYDQLRQKFPINFEGWQCQPAPNGVGRVLKEFGSDRERYGWRVR